MFEWKSIQAIAVYATAAIFGWVFYSLPKVTSRAMTWTFMLSCLGLAGIVGFVAGSVMSYAFPQLPLDLKCSLCSIVGASCTYFMDRAIGIVKKAADKVEEAVDAKPDKE